MDERNGCVYVVDDDPSMRDTLKDLIGSAGFNVDTFASAQEFLGTPRRAESNCLILDVQMPGLTGLDLQEELTRLRVHIPIIFLTGRGDIPMSVRAIKAGAVGFLTKPVRADDLLNAVGQAVEQSAQIYRDASVAAEDGEPSEQKRQSKNVFSEIVGQSPALQRVLKQIAHVASTDSTVLISGETGTGKEVIARAIHCNSRRRENAFVKLNCAAIPTGLLESELFGHEKGAFTGAIAKRIGRFEQADRGTIFLDEIGDMPLELQPKLLRILQEREFERLGGTRTLRTDARLIVATNVNLAERMEQKRFRSDLYYRLNVFPVALPPLRERREDIPLLVHHFVQKFSVRMNKRIDRISPDTIDTLLQYQWPGNVRELENFIERSIILCKDHVLRFDGSSLKYGAAAAPQARVSFPATLAAYEREMIEDALSKSCGKVAGLMGAAAKLRMPRQTLESKIKTLGIDKTQFKVQEMQ